MFDRLLDLEHRRLRVADRSQLANNTVVWVCKLMGGTGQIGLMRDRLKFDLVTEL